MRIIYFDIDCLRPDHLGCYGYNRPTSPTIDRIAGEGIRFENYYCASSPCLPSRTCLSSGRFGIRNGPCRHIQALRDLTWMSELSADGDWYAERLRWSGGKS